MAEIEITEFRGAMRGIGGSTPVPLWPALASQAVTIDGTERTATPFNALTSLVRVAVNGAKCRIDINASGSTDATNGKCVLADGVIEYHGVNAGDVLAVIASA